MVLASVPGSAPEYRIHSRALLVALVLVVLEISCLRQCIILLSYSRVLSREREPGEHKIGLILNITSL